MPPDVNHLAVIIESAVLSESVRTHEAETKVALGILAHKGGCDTAACPYVFYATGDSQHDGELVKNDSYLPVRAFLLCRSEKRRFP